MRFFKGNPPPPSEGDMTPMIDMVFQLVAFFMVAINFAEADQNERIHLPSSELAKPPEVLYEHPITLQLTKQGTVIFRGAEAPVDALRAPLRQEREYIKLYKGQPKEATIIIRGDADVKTGVVQRLIKLCQDLGFEKFALRAQQKEGI